MRTYILRTVLLIASIAMMTSCTISEAPEFITAKHIKVTKFDKDSVFVKGKLVFKNPNDVGATFILGELQTAINGQKVGKVKGTQFKVKARKTFTVPLDIHFSHKQFLKSNGGLLGILFNTLNDKELKYRVTGPVSLKKGFIKKTFDVDYADKFKLSDVE